MMGQRPTCWVAVCLVVLLTGVATAVDPRVTRLKALESSSKDGLIVFDEPLFTEYALSPDRPYHLVFFGSAQRLMDSPKLQLSKLKAEFIYTAKAFKSGPDADKIFFIDMWHEHAGPVFSRLGLQALPAIFHWSPSQVGKAGKKVHLPEAAKCGQGIQSYPWPAESIADFVKGRTSASHAPIDRPSFVKSPIFPLVALAFLGVGGLVAWKLYNSPIVRMTWLWCLGALVIYGFSTSGGMYNIIRGMPMYTYQPGGKVKWWLDQRSGQLGAEGFLMGSSYVVFSSCISVMVYALPHVKNAKLRGGLSVAAALMALAVGRGIFSAYTTKTHMSMRQFFWE